MEYLYQQHFKTEITNKSRFVSIITTYCASQPCTESKMNPCFKVFLLKIMIAHSLF